MCRCGGKRLWSRVLVTGGAGFVGSNLVMAVQERHPEAEITVVDDFRCASFENLAGFRGDVVAAETSGPETARLFAGDPPTVVFHLASITDTRVMDQRKMLYDNVEGFRGILCACATQDIPLVYASSAATYGITDGRMSEDKAGSPANVYGFSKLIFDNLARRALAARPSARIVGLRYFNVYGPREAHKGPMASMIHQLARRMMAGEKPRVFKHGEQKRDFVYVKDVVEATLLAATARRSGVFNVGSGRARSFNDLIAILNEVLGASLETEYFDNPYPFYQPFTEADLTAAREALGYQPKFSLEEGVRDYVAWLKSRTARPKGDDRPCMTTPSAAK